MNLSAPTAGQPDYPYKNGWQMVSPSLVRNAMHIQQFHICRNIYFELLSGPLLFDM